jgi:predicted nucleotide-binding protein
LNALTRQRQPDIRTVTQTIGDIQGSHNVTITGIQIGNVLDTIDETEEETAPVQPEVPAGLPFVFLSYSRRNARIMRRLRADLTAAGFTVWTDENLQPGTPLWMSSIETAIHSAMCAIVLLTPDSKKSEWVEKELATAKIHHKEIIPLLALGNEQTSVPLLLSSTQYLDIRSDADYRKALRSLTPVLRNLQRGVAVRA